MKLASYNWKGQEHVGLAIEGKLYSFVNADRKKSGYDMQQLLERGEAGLEWARQFESEILSGRHSFPPELVCSLEEVQFLPPVLRPEKIICLGFNYRAHAAETEMAIPTEPIFFSKYNNALAGPYDAIILPAVSEQVDYEVELAVVIGEGGKYISEVEAMDYVAGYMVFNDVSARDFQFRTGQWIQGKTFDSFAPCGPFLVTRDEIQDPHELRISLSLNGKVMQDSNTSYMIFRIPYLIHYFSKLLTLRPGDIISTGTPPGVGFARKPPVFLKEGDEVISRVEGIGQLVNCVRKE